MEKQEKQAIKITLRSTQRREGDTETVEQSLGGTLTVFGNGWRVAYREETEAGMGKTDTTLTVTEGRVVRIAAARPPAVWCFGWVAAP